MAQQQAPRPEIFIDAFEVLRKTSLLRSFTEVGLRLIAGASQRRSVARGTYVFRSGEPGTALHVIARGQVQLLARDGGTPLTELGPGEALGGLALLAGGEHLVSALALSDVELVELSIPAFKKLGAAKPQTGMKLLTALATDLGERLVDAKVPLREFLLWQVSKR